MINIDTLFFALLGGILPAIFWLWFWLKEDKKRPEPRGLLVLAFITGIILIPIVFGLEKLASIYIPDGIFLIIIWSAIEELMKYFGALFVALKSRFLDEPVDAMIYLITVALGFVAMENSLFLLSPLGESDIIVSFMTGNLRFMGASILHVLSSATIGIFIGLAFYKSYFTKKISLITGIILAITLHSAFNFFIIKGNGHDMFTIFGFLWVATVILLLIFEKIKRIKR